MTQNEITTIRTMLTDVLAAHTAEIDGKFKVIEEKLIRIEAQTTKTNGRVNRHDQAITDLEKADITHIANCPLESRMKVVEADVSARKSVWRFVVIASGAILSFALFVIALMEYFSKT